MAAVTSGISQIERKATNALFRSAMATQIKKCNVVVKLEMDKPIL